MGKAIAIFNQKGGVGKTTTNINLAACLAMKGKKVLILDIDPQGNTTSGVGISKRELDVTTHEILIEDDRHPGEAVVPTGIENLDIMPASVQLAGAEVELINIAGREKRLKMAIDVLKPEYDYIFIDCPPIDIVADTQIIEKYSDRTVFIIRAGLLERSMLGELGVFYNNKRFKNLSLILNGTLSSAGRYSYKYGYKYGYYGSSSYYASENM